MLVIQQMWDKLWNVSMDPFSFLHRAGSTYLTYVESNIEHFKEEFPSLFAKKNNTEKILQYVAWQTLGPQLIKGFNALSSTHDNYHSFTEKSFTTTSFSVLMEEPEAWKNPNEHLKFDKQLLKREFTMNLPTYQKIKANISDKNDKVIVYSYCLGIILAKSPMGPPECYGSAINLIKNNIFGKTDFITKLTKKTLPAEWEQQNESLKKQFNT